MKSMAMTKLVEGAFSFSIIYIVVSHSSKQLTSVVLSYWDIEFIFF